MPRKPPSRTTLKRKADRMFSLLIRERDGRCVNCGGEEYLQCAHGFSRRYHSVRWDPENAWALDRKCHVYFTHHPIEWDEWMVNRMGLEEYQALRAKARKPWDKDIEAVIEGMLAATKQARAALHPESQPEGTFWMGGKT